MKQDCSICANPPSFLARRCLVPKLEPEFPINPIGPLHVDRPTLPSQQNMHAAIAVSHANLADLLGANCQSGLIAATWLVVLG